MKKPTDIPVFVINMKYDRVRKTSSKVPASIFYSKARFTETGYSIEKDDEGKLALIYVAKRGFVGLAKIEKILGENESHKDRVNDEENHIRFKWSWEFPKPITYRDFQKKLWEGDILDLKEYEKDTTQFANILYRDRIPYFSKNDLGHLLSLIP